MNLKKLLSYGISVLIFIVASLLYFNPVLKGEKMSQSDITQFRGMAKEIQDFRASTGEEPYWAESAFSGMPSYQLSAYYPNDFVTHLDSLLRFLPRPADYLFLYFLGFFVLLSVLKVEWKLAVLGALSFGFSTYLIIIFGAGHNAKAHAIAYMPFVMSGVLLVFQKKYLLGFVVTALAMALEIKANHPQMTYYLGFAILIYGLAECFSVLSEKLIPAFKNNWKIEKSLSDRIQLISKLIVDARLIVPSLYKQVLIVVLAVVLGLGANASRLMAMKEYADYSTRGTSELTINPDGSEKVASTGLSKDYITEYSYGIQETFNLLVPRYMGGGVFEDLSGNSNTYDLVAKKFGAVQAHGFTENVMTYWGNQPIVEAPAYIGAVVFFLFFLGVFLVKGKLKIWLVSATVFSILLSWGKNFGILTDFFIDYIPMYNKFRAVSSIQVIAEFCVPILGILGLRTFLNSTNEQRTEALKKALYVTGGIVVFGYLLALFMSTFEGVNDSQYVQMEQQYGLNGLVEAVISDRRSMLFSDSIRSLILIGLSFGVLWFYLKSKLKLNHVIVALAAFVLFDLVSVNLNYVNEEDFKQARVIEKPFVASEADKQILKDKSHYRVANFSGNFMNEGRTSYFHKSVGGYHAAKMGRYNELIDYQVSKGNFEVLNMLNAKYFIASETQVQVNTDANGNAWFVNSLKMVNDANGEIVALDSLKTKEEAILNINEMNRVYNQALPTSFEKDSTANIKLVNYALNHLTYESSSAQDQFAVFSEIFYKDGWNAYLDGKLVPHVQVNYVLRGMKVPSGEHKIDFKFEPKVIKQGGTIALVSCLLLFIVPVGWFVISKKK